MKNEFEIRGDVTAIFVKAKGGKMLETLIDTSDLPIADSMPNSWYAHADSSQHRYYVEGQRSINKKCIRYSLARLIMGADKGDEVDHINHDTLDNRRSNLRIVTTAQNQQNRFRAQVNNLTSGIRGVSWDKKAQKWVAYIKLNQKSLKIGVFDSCSEAEKVVVLARAALMPYSPEARMLQWIGERYGAV